MDVWARFIGPGDFFVMLIVMLNIHDEDGIQFLTALSKVNIVMVLVPPCPKCGDSDQDSHAWVSGWCPQAHN